MIKSIQKFLMIAVIALAVLVNAPSPLDVSARAATTIHVSPAGSDSNNGNSLSAPLKTIQKALAQAQPGDTVKLAAGTYHQDVKTVRSGTSSQPITITGPPTAVVKGSSSSRIFQIFHDYITVRGFAIDGLFGASTSAAGYRDKLIYVQGTAPGNGVNGMVISGMKLRNAGGECVRLRYYAQHNEIANNTITNCGVHDFRFSGGGKNGEGIYIGTAPEQRADGKNPTVGPDYSNYNHIHHNYIDTRGNECVDIKESASSNIVERNICRGQKDSNSGGLDSRGNSNIFRYNDVRGSLGAGIRLGGDGVRDGINNQVYGNQIHGNGYGGIKVMRTPQGKICGNVLSGNKPRAMTGTYGSRFKPASSCTPTLAQSVTRAPAVSPTTLTRVATSASSPSASAPTATRRSSTKPKPEQNPPKPKREPKPVVFTLPELADIQEPTPLFADEEWNFRRVVLLLLLKRPVMPSVILGAR